MGLSVVLYCSVSLAALPSGVLGGGGVREEGGSLQNMLFFWCLCVRVCGYPDPKDTALDDLECVGSDQ